MGQGSYLKIINNSDNSLRLIQKSSYQMEEFNNFPKSIEPNSIKEGIYVEFDESIFHPKTDDSGTISYTLEGTNCELQINFKIDREDGEDVHKCYVSWTQIPNNWGVLPPFNQPKLNLWRHDNTCAIEINSSIPNSELFMTIMSWNVDKNGMGKDGADENGIEPLLNAFDRQIPIPDVLLLQETNVNEIGRFAEKLSELTGNQYNYQAYGVNENGREDGNGNAIIYRYQRINEGTLWLSNIVDSVTNQQFGYGGRNSVYADLLLPNSSLFRVYSTHIESGGKDILTVENWLREKCNQLRPLPVDITTIAGMQLAEVTQHSIEAKIPSIIAGDFNMQMIPDSIMEDFHDSHKYLSGLLDTCSARLGTRLDFILVDKNFINDIGQIYPGIAAQEEIKWISDHLPIWANIRIPSLNKLPSSPVTMLMK